jgi:transcription antitermination factor NusG
MHIMSSVAAHEDSRQWYAIWTRSHCEQLVNDQLAAHGFAVFLPTVCAWGRTAHGRARQSRALFPGYLFVQHDMDKTAHAAILKTRGVVRVLGEAWDRLSAIPEDEVLAVQRMVAPGLGAFRFAPPRDGERVRIHSGPLAGLQGQFVRARPTRGVFVVEVSLLNRSVAVELESEQVEVV